MSVLLMLGLVLPACVKAFAVSPASAAQTADTRSDGDDAAPGKLPCLTCCGNWLALLPAFALPDHRRYDAVIVSPRDGKPDAEVWSAIAGGDPPPEWPLALASPHSYARMHARTERLLL
ncbi:MAG: hypothetical protein AAF441_21390 [Pseudomonadota bacterium]